jgi:hypothetical protein
MLPKVNGQLTICVAEDRSSCEPGLKLLLLSLCRYTNNIAIIVFYPAADQQFLDWARELNPEKIAINTTPLPGAHSWNVKPQALLEVLRKGREEVVWIDSDVIVTGDILPTFRALELSTLVVTEEALWVPWRDDSGGLRARLWGFPVKRSFPFSFNTAVLRVTQAHVPLLERWKTILESPEYLRAQEQPWDRRPFHMFSDQEVLTALLSSGEFDKVPIKILRRGTGIIQYFVPYGFTLAERATCMIRGMPLFIHSQCVKSWQVSTDGSKPKNLPQIIKAVYQDLSPYTLVAKTLVTPTEAWMRPRHKLSLALQKLGFGYAPLVGLPIAAAMDLHRMARLVTRRIKSLRSASLFLRS